jgi:hypothetical protein
MALNASQALTMRAIGGMASPASPSGYPPPRHPVGVRHLRIAALQPLGRLQALRARSGRLIRARHTGWTLGGGSKSLLGVLTVLDGGTVTSGGTWQLSPRIGLLLTNVTGILSTDSISLRFI